MKRDDTICRIPIRENPYVPVPEVFFTVLLPEIEDTSELKVTLHLFWLLAQNRTTRAALASANWRLIGCCCTVSCVRVIRDQLKNVCAGD